MEGSGSGLQPKKFKTTELGSLMRFLTSEHIFLVSKAEIAFIWFKKKSYISDYHIQRRDCVLSRTKPQKAMMLILFRLLQ